MGAFPVFVSVTTRKAKRPTSTFPKFALDGDTLATGWPTVYVTVEVAVGPEEVRAVTVKVLVPSDAVSMGAPSATVPAHVVIVVPVHT